ncbi:MAG: phage virion morphogenesis protein [Anaerolineaceae bacterium]|nr:phage virion morphogenesis protein [Anaerolineaceae bacterium]
MTGVLLKVNQADFDHAERVLSRAINGNSRAFMDQVGDHVLAETLQNFMQEQTPGGKPWQTSERAKKEGGKTLQDSRRLFQSYTYQANATMAEIGTNTIYAAIHHHGGKTGRNHATTLPARPALGMTPEIQGDLQQLHTDWMGGLLSG